MMRWCIEASFLVLFAGLLACDGGDDGLAAAPGAPDIVLIVIDTARADRFSFMGYPRATTPRIDGLAAQGIAFTNAHSTSSWTVPSHASLFTGLYTVEHGANQEHNRLEEGPATLAELLGAAGYETVAVSGNAVVGQRTGLVRGFQRYQKAWRERNRGDPPGPAEHRTGPIVEALLSETDRDRPYFLFVNFVEPHGRYWAPAEHRKRFVPEDIDEALVQEALAVRAWRHYLNPRALGDAHYAVLNDLYDAELAYVDDLVADLLERLKRLGRLDNAVVVITSDHGETLRLIRIAGISRQPRTHARLNRMIKE